MGSRAALRGVGAAGECTYYGLYLLWGHSQHTYLQLHNALGWSERSPSCSLLTPPQVVGALTVLMRRPHNTFANNMKTAVVQASQAFTALAFLIGSLDLLPMPLADIAGVVMWSQIAAVAYIVFNQVGLLY